MSENNGLASIVNRDGRVHISCRRRETLEGVLRRVASSMRGLLLLVAVMLIVPAALADEAKKSDEAKKADEYKETVRLFRNAGESGTFFSHSYAYAVFPTIGKGGLILGAAHGEGRVYQLGKHVGDTSMTQVSVGLQAGGQTFSEIIFFQDRRAFREFEKGNYEFGADASAVAITSGASATAATTGTTAGASGGKKDATTSAGYHKGTAVFTIIKGGAMLQAAVGGQKFTYKPGGATAKPAPTPAAAAETGS
jgi:lipid-binding SYLF domain-containing protein